MGNKNLLLMLLLLVAASNSETIDSMMDKDPKTVDGSDMMRLGTIAMAQLGIMGYLAATKGLKVAAVVGGMGIIGGKLTAIGIDAASELITGQEFKYVALKAAARTKDKLTGGTSL